MNHLILIKHALPQINKTQSAPDWQLSDSGRASCAPLAEALRPYKPDLLITSEEPKARETGSTRRRTPSNPLLISTQLSRTRPQRRPLYPPGNMAHHRKNLLCTSQRPDLWQ